MVAIWWQDTPAYSRIQPCYDRQMRCVQYLEVVDLLSASIELED